MRDFHTTENANASAIFALQAGKRFPRGENEMSVTGRRWPKFENAAAGAGLSFTEVAFSLFGNRKYLEIWAVKCEQNQGYQVGILKAKFHKIGLFKRALAWKNGVWHVRHSLPFLAVFDGVGMKKHCLAFFKTSGSVSAVGLES